MKTIVIFNQKGGVGKTSSAVNLMAEYHRLKYKVLAIDLDAQCNLSAFFGIRDPKLSVRDWLLQKAKFAYVVQQTPYGDIIPAADSLQMELLRFSSMPAFVIRLRELLKAIPADMYDFVLIDCPPAVNQLTAAALVAANYVLIPTEAELFSAEGVGKIADTVYEVKSLNPSLKVLGVFLVKYNRQRVLTRSFEEKLVGETKAKLCCDVLNARIRFTVDIPAAQAIGLSVAEYKSGSNAAADYTALALETLIKIEEDEKENTK